MLCSSLHIKSHDKSMIAAIRCMDRASEVVVGIYREFRTFDIAKLQLPKIAVKFTYCSRYRKLTFPASELLEG